MGGSVVALGCRTCNNLAGRTFDAEMEKWHALTTLDTPDIARPVRATIEIADMAARGEFVADGENVRFSTVPKQNPPGVADAIGERMSLVDEGMPFDLTLAESALPRWSAIGWMRSAYLIAFAALGYTYIVGTPALEPLRRQFLEPDCEHIPIDAVLPVGTDRRQDHKTRQLRAAVSGHDTDGMLVAVLGWHLIHLPAPGASSDFYDRLANDSAFAMRATQVNRWRSIPFPRRMECALDGRAGALGRTRSTG
jgi:hypothetical protein